MKLGEWRFTENVPISYLTGKTVTKVEQLEDQSADLRFHFSEDEPTFNMGHTQNCCESVWLEDICGDLSDLENSPILEAEERPSDRDYPLGDHDESYTWTFYRISTIKGTVVLRWYGTSNGYYSEEADCWLRHKTSRY